MPEQLTEAQLALVREASREAAQQVLVGLGVDAADPTSVQRDMQFLRDMRETSATVRHHSYLTAIGLGITGVAAMIVLGLRSFFTGN